MAKRIKFYADIPTKSVNSVMVNTDGMKIQSFIPPVEKIVEHIEQFKGKNREFFPFTVTIPVSAFSEAFKEVKRKVPGGVDYFTEKGKLIRGVRVRIGSDTKVLVIIKCN